MLNYDKEADAYDASRGGEPRAEAATEAVLGLIPDRQGRLLDVACGTGIVTRRFAAANPALRVTGADLAPGMARMAAARLPGAVLLADSRRLPFADATFDAVTSIWLLHLLSDPADVRAVVAECARVLRPGGVYVTTVDKAAAHDVGSDIDTVLAPRPRRPAQDAAEAVTAHAAEHRLQPAGQASFPGLGQGRSPRSTIADLRRGWFTALQPGDPRIQTFAEDLARLPHQDRPRPDPVFRVRAFRKPAAA
ncbi:class I SAM-dependent methyltransferase [Streptomyces sp. Ag109_G2-15]|uniref:class I SAM-dependent methyltransferase n=1 Tax=Streptomyces sp. Ag109_G2-15 TaxID=1938850 RepID=UPI000BC70D09|nr:class I SAM-dependent methyltransferase [Streptomyces sp. Ag109_G2-15]SOE08031.1 Methyltransferase domain-containing protein [Streptomyces sp. Ag109_G2-15]